MSTQSSPSQTPLLVACLCANWCGTCRDYRPLFVQLTDTFPDVHFVWIDIEDAKGGKWVVDYKTSGHEGGGVDAFLDAERERYKAQLDRYADAMGGARRGLYFPLLGGWREW